MQASGNGERQFKEQMSKIQARLCDAYAANEKLNRSNQDRILALNCLETEKSSAEARLSQLQSEIDRQNSERKRLEIRQHQVDDVRQEADRLSPVVK